MHSERDKLKQCIYSVGLIQMPRMRSLDMSLEKLDPHLRNPKGTVCKLTLLSWTFTKIHAVSACNLHNSHWRVLWRIEEASGLKTKATILMRRHETSRSQNSDSDSENVMWNSVWLWAEPTVKHGCKEYCFLVIVFLNRTDLISFSSFVHTKKIINDCWFVEKQNLICVLTQKISNSKLSLFLRRVS